MSITLILDERYMCRLMKVQNNSQDKYIAYSLASYYLSLIRSRDSIVNVVYVLIFTINFCYDIKKLMIISNSLKIRQDKTIVSNWYPSLDNKLIRECVDSVLQSLDSGLTYHRSYL